MMCCSLIMLIFILFCQNSQSANPINDNVVLMNKQNQIQNQNSEMETPNLLQESNENNKNGTKNTVEIENLIQTQPNRAVNDQKSKSVEAGEHGADANYEMEYGDAGTGNNYDYDAHPIGNGRNGNGGGRRQNNRRNGELPLPGMTSNYDDAGGISQPYSDANSNVNYDDFDDGIPVPGQSGTNGRRTGGRNGGGFRPRGNGNTNYNDHYADYQPDYNDIHPNDYGNNPNPNVFPTNNGRRTGRRNGGRLRPNGNGNIDYNDHYTDYQPDYNDIHANDYGNNPNPNVRPPNNGRRNGGRNGGRLPNGNFDYNDHYTDYQQHDYNDIHSNDYNSNPNVLPQNANYENYDAIGHPNNGINPPLYPGNQPGLYPNGQPQVGALPQFLRLVTAAARQQFMTLEHDQTRPKRVLNQAKMRWASQQGPQVQQLYNQYVNRQRQQTQQYRQRRAQTVHQRLSPQAQRVDHQIQIILYNQELSDQQSVARIENLLRSTTPQVRQELQRLTVIGPLDGNLPPLSNSNSII